MTSDSGPERKFSQIALADLERQLGVAERAQLRRGRRTPAPLWP